ncbi:hypothetical protein ACVMIL_000049 [Bradyrhizobium barranii subsp. barranii]
MRLHMRNLVAGRGRDRLQGADLVGDKVLDLGGLQAPVGRSKSPGYGHLKLPHLMIAVSAAEQQ